MNDVRRGGFIAIINPLNQNRLLLWSIFQSYQSGYFFFGTGFILTSGRLTDIIVARKEGMNMTMQSMLREKNMSMYRLSQISGVPKTTVIDICSGKSDIEGCTAKTVMQLSRALGCTMEELMQIDNARYDRSTGLPKDESYLEKGLPAYLQNSITAM